MRKSLFCFTALCIMFSSGVCRAQLSTTDSLTVERAVQMTVANHPLIRQAGYGVTAAQARIAGSRSMYCPDISLAGMYTLLEPIPSIDIPDLGSFQMYPANNYDFHLEARQMLYDFGRTSAGVELAESGLRTAGDHMEVVKSGLAYQTTAVFNAILILHRTIAVIDEQIETLEQHVGIINKMIQAGTATDFDSLTTEVRIAAALNERVEAVLALENQEIAFRQLTGLGKDQPVCLRGSLYDEPRAIDPDSALAEAKRQRPELIMSRESENSAEIRARLASLGNRPSVALGLTSGFKNGYFPDLNKPEANIAVGVQLVIPIFNGFQTRHQRVEADADIRAGKAQTASIERQVTGEVEQAVAGVKASVRRIENSRVQVRRAEAALSRAEAKYEAGVVTNMDLLDLQAALSQAKLTHLKSVYDYIISLNALDKATGRKIW